MVENEGNSPAPRTGSRRAGSAGAFVAYAAPGLETRAGTAAEAVVDGIGVAKTELDVPGPAWIGHGETLTSDVHQKSVSRVARAHSDRISSNPPHVAENRDRRQGMTTIGKKHLSRKDFVQIPPQARSTPLSSFTPGDENRHVPPRPHPGEMLPLHLPPSVPRIRTGTGAAASKEGALWRWRGVATDYPRFGARDRARTNDDRKATTR
jgi:hypothetical protein